MEISRVYEFEGQTFPTLAAFKAAFPAYARHAHRVREGVSTVLEMEKQIAAANGIARARSLAGARSTPAYTFSRKARYHGKRGAQA